MHELSNREISESLRRKIEKADIAVSDLISSGGILLPEQLERFLRLAIDHSVFLQDVTFKTMRSPTWRMDKIKFGSRVLRRAQSATQPLSQGDRVKPDLSRTELTTTEFICESDIPDQVLEDNIEKEDLQNTILDLLAEAMGRDVEEAALLSDTASSDDFLKGFEGFLKLATSHVVDLQDTKATRDTWKEMWRAMPTRYSALKSKMKIYTDKNACLDYGDSLDSRAGDTADGSIRNDSDLVWKKMPVIEVPLMPANVGTGTHCTNALMLVPENAHVGVMRAIQIEIDRDIRARSVIIVGTVRFGVQYEDEPSIVLGENINAQAGA